MLNRKKFIQNVAMTAGAIVIGPRTTDLFSMERLTILHTNDTHSRLDPFPMDGSRNQGLGGVAARAALIRRVRQEQEHVLLLDAGDIFQGTPYFNIYKGEPEIKAMAVMGYDACTIGNHDFDAGLENLANQLTAHANFPMLVSNYDFNQTPMENKTLPYKVFRKGRLKIGVFGLGIELRGLVPDNLYQNTRYLDPLQKANETAALLRNKEDCDMIVCLSHLGYQYKTSNKVSDEIVAKESENIDLIIGGHTHTFLDNPIIIKNKKRRGCNNQPGRMGRYNFRSIRF